MQIYFIQQGDSDLVKIGFTSNIQRRFRELQTASPYPLLLLGLMPGSKEVEKQIHGTFEHLRQKREWFKLNQELSNYISKYCEFEDLPILTHRKRKY